MFFSFTPRMPDARVRKTPFLYGNTHPDHGGILFLNSHFDAVNGKCLEMSWFTALVIYTWSEMDSAKQRLFRHLAAVNGKSLEMSVLTGFLGMT